MASRVDVQYIRFYTDGNAAKKIAPVLPEKKPQRMPRVYKVKRKVVRIDPVAVLSIGVCIALFISLAVGVGKFRAAKAENARMAQYVQQLTQENEALSQTYAAGYDLQEIEKTAQALGMVSASQANYQSATVMTAAADQQAPATFWESFLAFFANSLFVCRELSSHKHHDIIF